MVNLLAPIENTPYVGGADNSFITVDVNGLQVTLAGIDGELVTWSAAGVPETVAAGTSGQILTSNGPGAAPTFETGGGGGINNVVEDTSPQYGGVMDTNSFALDESEGTPVANAASMDIWAADGNTIHITGSTGPTTSLGTAPRVGAWRKCIFDSTPTWNDGANIILPGSANFAFAADDIAYVYAETTTQFRVAIFKGDGTAVVGGAGSQTPWTSDIDQNGFSITDGGGLEILSFVETASAVNEITIANAATGGSPVISATGGDSEIPLAVKPKGAQAFFDIDSDSATSDSILRFKVNGASEYVFGFDESTGNFRFDASTTGAFPGTTSIFTHAGGGSPLVFSQLVRMNNFLQGSSGASMLLGSASSVFIQAPASGNILFRTSAGVVLVEIGSTGDLSFGLDDASPTANTVQGQSASGTDIAGAPINVGGGQGTGTGLGGNVVIQTAPAGTTGSSLNALVDAIEVDSAQNVRLSGSAAHATTAGTGIISLFNGTAPVGTLTNGASLYVASGELNVIDSGGVVTLLSPHDHNGEWIFYSKNTVTGRTIKFRMEELMKRLAELVGPELFEEFYDET